MERLKATAADCARHATEQTAFDLPLSTLRAEVTLQSVREYVCGAEDEGDEGAVLVKTVALIIFLNSHQLPQSQDLLSDDDDKHAWEALCQWTANHAVPGPDFAQTWAELALQTQTGAPQPCSQRREGVF
ncbi:hypothetical protein KEM52_001057 [Ascosphaera acerosa]|nr:hypothetical protein KEM52_001057 [Ascosphaera acerosa]